MVYAYILILFMQIISICIFQTNVLYYTYKVTYLNLHKSISRIQVPYRVFPVTHRNKKIPIPLKGEWGHGNNKGDAVRYISLAYPVRMRSERKCSGVSVAILTPASIT